ncbi:recombinase family protein [Nocardiopsis protaetiae]|uniref:hypothetical protein n=1 Tax=Nocardiopsis protaetiae TaxID=3382270 RepID=UPI00387B3C7B
MTEIAIRSDATLEAKIEYTRQLAHADMLPSQYRQKPANLLFAIEYAEMLGLSPMAAITGIHVIEGRPSASANLITDLVRRAGHRLRVRVEYDQRGLPAAVAQIVRHDDTEWTFEARWDMDRAVRAGLVRINDGKPVARDSKGRALPWEKFPEAMLKARAITEVAREACAEALSGVGYTPEELGATVDERGEIVATDVTPVRRGSAGPGASVRAAAAAAVVEQAQQETAQEPAAEEAPVRMITPAQTRKLGAAMRENGISGRADALAYVAEVIGREVGSRNELTVDEAGRVIDALERGYAAAQDEAAAAPASEEPAAVDEPADAEVAPETPESVWRDLVEGSGPEWTVDLLEQGFAQAHDGLLPASASIAQLMAWGGGVLRGTTRPPVAAPRRPAAPVEPPADAPAPEGLPF